MKEVIANFDIEAEKMISKNVFDIILCNSMDIFAFIIKDRAIKEIFISS